MSGVAAPEIFRASCMACHSISDSAVGSQLCCPVFDYSNPNRWSRIGRILPFRPWDGRENTTYLLRTSGKAHILCKRHIVPIFSEWGLSRISYGDYRISTDPILGGGLFDAYCQGAIVRLGRDLQIPVEYG